MKTIFVSVYLMVSMLLFSCAPTGMKSLEDRLTDDGYRRLTAEEITNRISGNTINAKVSGITFYIYHKSDGTFVGKRVSSSGQERPLSGKWSVSEKANTFCNQFEAHGGSDCDLIYAKDDEIVFVEHNGHESSRGVIEEGNSRDL